MRQGAMSLQKAVQPGPGEVPVLVRFLGKFVLEVLPAALASVIGAFLFAHYQFSEPGVSGPAGQPAAEAAPASAAMMQLVRQEHAMIRDFLLAEQTAEEKRVAAADAADANAVADAQIAAAARQALLVEIAEKPVAEINQQPAAKRSKGSVVASAANAGHSVPTAQLPPVVVAAAQQDTAPTPPAPQASFVSRTLAVPGHVMAATLRGVMAVGGIPSWIGHHVGATELDSDAPLPSPAY